MIVCLCVCVCVREAANVDICIPNLAVVLTMKMEKMVFILCFPHIVCLCQWKMKMKENVYLYKMYMKCNEQFKPPGALLVGPTIWIYWNEYNFSSFCSFLLSFFLLFPLCCYLTEKCRWFKIKYIFILFFLLFTISRTVPIVLSSTLHTVGCSWLRRQWVEGRQRTQTATWKGIELKWWNEKQRSNHPCNFNFPIFLFIFAFSFGNNLSSLANTGWLLQYREALLGDCVTRWKCVGQ